MKSDTSCSMMQTNASTRHADDDWAATVRRVQGVTGLNDQAATALLHRWQDNEELAINSYFDMPEAPAAPKRQKPAMLPVPSGPQSGIAPKLLQDSPRCSRRRCRRQ